MYYTDISRSKARCDKVVPFTRFPSALRNRLPGFSWITPNLCFDMHDCSIRKGDGFLHRWVPRIEQHLGSDGIVIVVFDEGSSDDGCCDLGSAGGHVAAIIAGLLSVIEAHTSLALAQDRAFSFMYPHLLDRWRAAGAVYIEVVTDEPALAREIAHARLAAVA